MRFRFAPTMIQNLGAFTTANRTQNSSTIDPSSLKSVVSSLLRKYAASLKKKFYSTSATYDYMVPLLGYEHGTT